MTAAKTYGRPPRPLPRAVDDRALLFGLAVLGIFAALSAVMFVVGPVWP